MGPPSRKRRGEMRTDDPNSKLLDALCTSLRRRQIVGSLSVALATAALIQNIVRSYRFDSFEELISILKTTGKALMQANPKELAAGNIVRKILRLIREEFRAAAVAAQASEPSSAPDTPFMGPVTPGIHAPSNHYLSNELRFDSPSPTSSTQPLPTPGVIPLTPFPGGLPLGFNRQTSLSNFLSMRHSRAQLERGTSVMDLSASTTSFFTPPTRGSSMDELSLSRTNSEDFGRQSIKLKPVFLQAIEEVVGELETTHEDVARRAREHIHSSEVILTMGNSRTIDTFLKQAFRDRKFTVIVAESAPTYSGHTLAASLSASGIPTILVPDSAVYALMPRITKIVLGAHTVLANGGLFALSGSLSVALAAKAHSTPVVVATGQFKFAPAWNLYHELSAVDYQGPGNVVGFEGNGGGGGVEGVEVDSPYYDYIRPELINLFVTNEGDHSPSYIYRLIKDAYEDEDIEL